jgi:hypothetical protein
MPGGSLGLFDVVFLSETFYTTGGVHELLLSGKERVAGGADFDLDVFCGRTGFYNISARTGDFGKFVFGMNAFFHKNPLYLVRSGCAGVH